MRRLQFKLRTLLIAAALVGWFCVAGPYWHRELRHRYLVYRITTIQRELVEARRAYDVAAGGRTSFSGNENQRIDPYRQRVYNLKRRLRELTTRR